MIKTLLSDDVVYNLAVILDTIGGKLPSYVYSEIASFLQKSDTDRSRLSITYPYLQRFSSEAVLKSLDDPGIPLDEVIQGEAISIYLMVSPAKLRNYSDVLRLWIGTILECVQRRQKSNAVQTLLILDECGQLGTISQLTASIPFWERHPLLLWTFWQNTDEARNLYSSSWMTSQNIVQCLATKNHSSSLDISGFLGVKPGDISSLSHNEQIVWRNGELQKIEQL